MSVTILDHALIQHKLTIMRDKNTSTYIFKQNLDEIAKLMAFEVTRNVSIKDKAIELIKKDLGKVDLVVYSLAAPRRTDSEG